MCACVCWPRRSGTLYSVLCVVAGALRRAPVLSVSGPNALWVGPPTLCVGTRRSLCRALALHVSGPGPPYGGARTSLGRARSLSPRHSLYRALALSRSPALSHPFIGRAPSSEPHSWHNCWTPLNQINIYQENICSGSANHLSRQEAKQGANDCCSHRPKV